LLILSIFFFSVSLRSLPLCRAIIGRKGGTPCISLLLDQNSARAFILMSKNILYSIAGVVLGFFIGFFIANFGGRPRPGAGAPGTSAARPTDQTRSDGQLPPGHPNLNDGSGANGSAAFSAQAQQAMDAADRNPQDFTAQLKAAAIFYQLSSLDKAELYLKRALELKPDDPDALTGMGHTKYDTGDFTSAATYYEKVLAKQPDDADLRTDLGNAYSRRQPPDYDRAMKEFRKALEVNPAHEQALVRLADVALRTGDKTTAGDAIDKLAAVNPSSPSLSSLRSKLNGQ
jgi:tetratricopeptide (TPR) repeat protein